MIWELYARYVKHLHPDSVGQGAERAALPYPTPKRTLGELMGELAGAPSGGTGAQSAAGPHGAGGGTGFSLSLWGRNVAHPGDPLANLCSDIAEAVADELMAVIFGGPHARIEPDSTVEQHIDAVFTWGGRGVVVPHGGDDQPPPFKRKAPLTAVQQRRADARAAALNEPGAARDLLTEGINPSQTRQLPAVPTMFQANSLEHLWGGIIQSFDDGLVPVGSTNRDFLVTAFHGPEGKCELPTDAALASATGSDLVQLRGLVGHAMTTVVNKEFHWIRKNFEVGNLRTKFKHSVVLMIRHLINEGHTSEVLKVCRSYRHDPQVDSEEVRSLMSRAATIVTEKLAYVDGVADKPHHSMPSSSTVGRRRARVAAAGAPHGGCSCFVPRC